MPSDQIGSWRRGARLEPATVPCRMKISRTAVVSARRGPWECRPLLSRTVPSTIARRLVRLARQPRRVLGLEAVSWMMRARPSDGSGVALEYPRCSSSPSMSLVACLERRAVAAISPGRRRCTPANRKSAIMAVVTSGWPAARTRASISFRPSSYARRSRPTALGIRSAATARSSTERYYLLVRFTY